MVSLLKSTVLGVGLLAGVAATANAQSTSGLPSDGSTPPSYGGTLRVQNAHTGIAGSTQSFYPKPGGGGPISITVTCRRARRGPGKHLVIAFRGELAPSPAARRRPGSGQAAPP